jgi:hypothetical protein
MFYRGPYRVVAKSSCYFTVQIVNWQERPSIVSPKPAIFLVATLPVQPLHHGRSPGCCPLTSVPKQFAFLKDLNLFLSGVKYSRLLLSPLRSGFRPALKHLLNYC